MVTDAETDVDHKTFMIHRLTWSISIKYLPSATKLRQGNIFRGVCQSFCSQGVEGGVCLSACWDTPPGQTPPPLPLDSHLPQEAHSPGKHTPEAHPPETHPWDNTPQKHTPMGSTSPKAPGSRPP